MTGHAQITCTAAEATGFAVQVGNKHYQCNRTGEVVDVSQTISGGHVTGSIICPSYQDVCTVSVFPVVAIIFISIIIHYSLFVIRYSLFVIRYSLFVIRYSLFVIRYSLFVIRYSLFVSIQYSVFSGYVSLFIAHYYYCHYYILSSSLSS